MQINAYHSKYRPFLISIIFCFSLSLSNISYAQLLGNISKPQSLQNITLKAFLDIANNQGLSILYSSDLILPRYRVTQKTDNEITIKQVKHVLKAYGLQLKQADVATFIVMRKAIETVANTNQIGDASVEADQPQIEEIIVTSSRHRLLRQLSNSQILLAQSDLHKRPALGNDAFRIVNTLPGSASNGISARPKVRGGNEDETLIMFDGVRLYKPFHLNSFNSIFGSFDSRIIESLDFYSGGFPSKYGDRLSAAIIMTPRTQETPENIREVGIGLYNVSYFQSGTNGTRDWTFSLRRSALELISSAVEQDFGEPTFADLYARYAWQINDAHKISASLFFFGDDVELERRSAQEKSANVVTNTYLWLKSEYNPSDRYYLESIFSVTKIEDTRVGSVANENFVTGQLTDDREFTTYRLKQDLEYTPGANWMLLLGWDYAYHTANYRYQSNLEIDPLFSNISNYPRQDLDITLDEIGHQYAIYSSLKWRLKKNLSIETGLRIDGQHFENTVTTNQLNPRLSLLYQPFQSTELRFSFGKYSQLESIYELKIEDGIRTFQAPQRTNHIIIALNQSLPYQIQLKIEAYKKDGGASNPYYQNLSNSLSLVPELQPDRFKIEPDEYEAQGIEFVLQGKWHQTNYWANYTIASAKDEFDGIKTNRSWDQRQSFGIGFDTTFKQWQLAFSGTVHDGWPTTALELEDGIVKVGARNNLRFKKFMSWDLKAQHTWQYTNSALRAELGITNLLNRNNQIGSSYQVKGGNLIQSPKNGLGAAPFIDVFWRF